MSPLIVTGRFGPCGRGLSLTDISGIRTVIVAIGVSLAGASGIPNWGGGSDECQARPTSGPLALCRTVPSKHALPGCIVAGAAGYSTITSAPNITSLWEVVCVPKNLSKVRFARVHTIKIDVYPPAILPTLAVYGEESLLTGSSTHLNPSVTGEDFDSRIQGGLSSDGLGGSISALFTVTPLSIFAQNIGVIALARCANRAAGRSYCASLILLAFWAKCPDFSSLTVPNPILGGVTTFVFASVVISAMSFGVGDLLMPDVFTYLFEEVKNPNSGLQGLFDSITIVLSTPSVILNLILPQEALQLSKMKNEGVEEVVDDVEALNQECRY
ncbi:hypothetical protein PAXINDRAFT_182641 [Paxillus involutus ATCC 200175]|uniref:Purine permease n=1 Tax=Paxillus involutus ATCC 200175 TaxID=664439 RepID=A0A0C9T5Z9_PAXIN|nr:hypothetical protein PAXINDRAFT_182641 [Paxillus involutus ATCC 200175]